MTKLEHALALAAKGFKVFPIAPGQKKPPLLNGWPKRATSDADEVRAFWSAVPEANIGIHCEGMVVIDVDVKKGGDDSLALLEMTNGIAPTLTTRTPTGGRHLFFRLSDSHSGVPNSVELLGRGLDVRSAGGYVLGPGSQVDAGDYAFELDTAGIASAPAWLVDRLGAAPVPRAEPAAPIPVASESAFRRAREWIAEQPGAVEGEGGDARTYAVACGLRDLGIDEAQSVSLLTDWNVTCRPPWSADDLAIKAHNAYRYAQNEPGARAALPEDFPVPEAAPEAPAAPRKALLRLSEFAAAARRGPGYLVKGLLERRSYANLFGAPGEGKTFIGLDLAYSVAAALPWHDRKVRSGVVLYLAYEGFGGLTKRAQALRQKYGQKDVPLYVAEAAFNLREPTGRKELGQVLAGLPEKPVLIVVDTFARALMGGDENSAQDVGAFNAAIAALIESTGACVLIIHHSGKNKAAGARGSSALQGAIDTELEVDQRQVISRKQRDVEAAEPIGFKLVPLIVGIDEDMDDITSCVVEPAISVAAGNVRLGGNPKRGMQVLCEMAPDNTPVHAEDWKEKCAGFLGNRRGAFWDMKATLLKKGVVIEAANGTLTRRLA
jgi:hypothetical protein